LPACARTHAIAASSPEARLGVRQLRGLTMLFFYALPDEAGHNDNWDALGYPGPLSAPPSPTWTSPILRTRRSSLQSPAYATSFPV